MLYLFKDREPEEIIGNRGDLQDNAININVFFIMKWMVTGVELQYNIH
jgi:hypothetical protein